MLLITPKETAHYAILGMTTVDKAYDAGMSLVATLQVIYGTPAAPSPTASTTLVTNVQFPFGSATITRVANAELGALVTELQPVAKRITSMRIDGFADYVGSQYVNGVLSRKRAEAVLTVLVSGLGNGVRKHVAVDAHGKSNALANSRQDPLRRYDRRVVIHATWTS